MAEPRFITNNAELFTLAEGLAEEADNLASRAAVVEAAPSGCSRALRRRAQHCRDGAGMIERLARLDPQILRALESGELGRMLNDMRAEQRRARLRAVG